MEGYKSRSLRFKKRFVFQIMRYSVADDFSFAGENNPSVDQGHG